MYPSAEKSPLQSNDIQSRILKSLESYSSANLIQSQKHQLLFDELEQLARSVYENNICDENVPSDPLEFFEYVMRYARDSKKNNFYTVQKRIEQAKDCIAPPDGVPF